MYDTMVNDLADTILTTLQAKGQPVPDRGELILGIGEYFKDRAVASWCIEDVIGRANSRGIPIGEKHARTILSDIENHHNAELGITWDTIDSGIDDWSERDSLFSYHDLTSAERTELLGCFIVRYYTKGGSQVFKLFQSSNLDQAHTFAVEKSKASGDNATVACISPEDFDGIKGSDIAVQDLRDSFNEWIQLYEVSPED